MEEKNVESNCNKAYCEYMQVKNSILVNLEEAMNICGETDWPPAAVLLLSFKKLHDDLRSLDFTAKSCGDESSNGVSMIEKEFKDLQCSDDNLLDEIKKPEELSNKQEIRNMCKTAERKLTESESKVKDRLEERLQFIAGASTSLLEFDLSTAIINFYNKTFQFVDDYYCAKLHFMFPELEDFVGKKLTMSEYADYIFDD